MKSLLPKRKYLLKYTILFALFSAGAFWVFWMSGKSFVWNQDGEPQYVPYLAYMGSYLRDAIKRALRGDFTIRMFDFKIGYGDDVGSIIRAHPLDFLSVFVPLRYTEQLYTFLIFFRIYLAGISFSMFAFYFHLPEMDVITGAMIYAFSGYVLRFGIVHPTFSAPFIFFPLLLLAAERMMRKEGFRFFAFMVFLGFMSNYYFMYVSAVALAVYVLIRFPILFPKDRLRNFGTLFIKMTAAFLLGTAMAMATLLPVVYNLTSSARLSGETASSFMYFYGASRWYRVLADLITPKVEPGYGTHMNMAALVLPAIALVFCEKRKNFSIKAALIAEYLMLIFPIGAYVMSMFSGVNNRWMFVLAFTCAVVYVVEAQHLRSLKRNELLYLTGIMLMYLGISLNVGSGKLNHYRTFAVASLAVSMVIFYLIKKLHIEQKIAQVVLLVFVFVCVSANGYYVYHSSYGDFASEFLERGSALPTILDSEFAWINRIDDTSFYRVDSNLVTSNKENYSVLLGYNGTSQYNSILNGPLTYELLETESSGIGAIHRFHHLDGRPFTSALANVKYYFTTADGKQHVPYGFHKVEELSDTSYAVYQNDYPLSFGITYDSVISRKDYEELSAAAKEKVQLCAAVLDTIPDGLSELNDAALENAVRHETVPGQLPESGVKAVKTDTGYSIKKDGSIQIPYERRAGYTCYLRLIGLSNKRTYTFINVDTSRSSSLLLIRAPGTIYSLNRTEYMVNLGYDDQDMADAVTLSFTRASDYTLSGAEFIYIPMEDYPRIVTERNQEALEETEFHINEVKGKVNVSSEKVMMFSVPYSKGWSVYVDGEKQETLSVNTAWLGTFLTAGEHSITLRYASPGAFIGRMIALAAWLFFLVCPNIRTKR